MKLLAGTIDVWLDHPGFPEKRSEAMQPSAPSQQHADVDGQGSIVVQIVGENNRVTIAGAVGLRLSMFPRRRKESGEIGLLSAYTQSIDLVGRDQELADLRRWLGSDRDIAIQVRTGKAGTGKTRLAYDLCDQLQAEGKWLAGFVNRDHLTRLVADAGACWGWGQPTLAVVDYAAEHAEMLHRWFGQLADFVPASGLPLRILLLERQAESESGWLQTALGMGDFQGSRDPSDARPREAARAPWSRDRQDRRTVLDAVFAKLGSPIRAPTVGADPDFDRRLAELTWGGEPLFLMMAALLAAETSLPQVLALPRTNVAHEVAEREIGRVRRLACGRGLDPDLLAHMAAYVTLCQGIQRDELLTAIEAEAGHLQRGLGGGAALLADALAEAHSGTAANLDPVRPDVLGEALVLRTLSDVRIDGAAVVARAFGHAGRKVAATVVRVAQDFADAGCKQPLAWLKALTEASFCDIRILSNILHQIPKASIVLDDCAIQLSWRLLVPLEELARRGLNAYYASLYITTSNDLAERLSLRGKHTDAVTLAQESLSVRLLIRKFSSRPGALNEIIAAAHCTLSNCYLALGKSPEALTHAEEALSELHSRDPFSSPRICAQRARALTSMGSALSELHEYDRALAVRRETLLIYVKLRSARLKSYAEKFIISLTNLANAYGNLRLDKKALPLAHKATLIGRRLVVENPDEFRPILSIALLSLANSLIGAGKPEKARERAKETIALCRKLKENNPTAYGPRLAAAVATLANAEEELGDLYGAQRANRDAIEALRPYFLQNPRAYRRWMTDMVHQYRRRCRKLRQAPGSVITPVEIVLRQMTAEE